MDIKKVTNEVTHRETEELSDVLVGAPASDIIRIQEAMGLMNSMIYSGEKHTQKSQKIFHEAMEILRNAKKGGI